MRTSSAILKNWSGSTDEKCKSAYVIARIVSRAFFALGACSNNLVEFFAFLFVRLIRLLNFIFSYRETCLLFESKLLSTLKPHVSSQLKSGWKRSSRDNLVTIDNVYYCLINKISMRCRGGRTVQAAACRAAICGFNSHPRLPGIHPHSFFHGMNPPCFTPWMEPYLRFLNSL